MVVVVVVGRKIVSDFPRCLLLRTGCRFAFLSAEILTFFFFLFWVQFV